MVALLHFTARLNSVFFFPSPVLNCWFLVPYLITDIVKINRQESEG